MAMTAEQGLASLLARTVTTKSGCVLKLGNPRAYVTHAYRGPGPYHGRVIGGHKARLLYAGVDVPEGAVILHACNNKRCLNLAHLSVGTQAQNVADAIADGLNPNYLHPTDVREMRHAFAAGAKVDALARALDVSIDRVQDALTGRTFAQAGGPLAEDNGRLRRSGVCDETVRSIRNFDWRRLGSLKDNATAHGVTEGYCSLLVRGLRRVEAGGPIRQTRAA